MKEIQIKKGIRPHSQERQKFGKSTKGACWSSRKVWRNFMVTHRSQRIPAAQLPTKGKRKLQPHPKLRQVTVVKRNREIHSQDKSTPGTSPPPIQAHPQYKSTPRTSPPPGQAHPRDKPTPGTSPPPGQAHPRDKPTALTEIKSRRGLTKTVISIARWVMGREEFIRVPS